MRTVHVAIGFTLVIAASGCKKTEPPTERTETTPAAATASAPLEAKPPPVAPASVAPAPEPPAPKVELAVRAAGSTMKFDKTALTVPAGSEVHLTLKVSLPGLLPHNWVLVRAGTEAAVAAAGLAKGQAENYLAPGPDVLAYTPLVLPGTESDVTFKAPPAGKYPYICTFPGHYMMMKGVLTVTP